MPSIAEPPPRRTLLLVDDCVAERELYEIALETEFNILTANRGSGRRPTMSISRSMRSPSARQRC